MNNEYRIPDSPHSVILEGRQRISIAGVREVMSFDENEIVMDTNRGMLTIGGEELHVEKLSLDIGELIVEGTIDAIVYSEEKGHRGGFWSRIF
ncbi:MAG: sporulation protein YabP [Clostridia bacterium]|nr:sporulation protein YabP [Clostridia bacterium]